MNEYELNCPIDKNVLDKSLYDGSIHRFDLNKMLPVSAR